jgi:hypothetical protein
METRQVDFEKWKIQQRPILGEPFLPSPVVPRPADGEPAFVRMDCSFCGTGFVLEVASQWDRLPEEMEVEGRRFLGIREDSLLCPECVGDAEVAGAERMYWALSHSL